MLKPLRDWVHVDAGGGPDRVRTDDLLDANQALSQLSYGPDYLPKHTSQTPRRSRRLGKPDKFQTLASPSNGNVDHCLI